LDNNTGFRENSATPIPPVIGGFALVRVFSVMLLIVFAVNLVGALVAPSGGVLAQGGRRPTSSDKDTAVREVVTLDSEIDSVNAHLGALERKSEELQAEIGAIDEEVAFKRKRLTAKRHALAQRARNIYVNGRSSTVVMLLASDDVSEFVKRTDYVNKINERDTELVVSIKQEAAKLDARLSDLKTRKLEVDDVASEQRSRRSSLVSARADREKVIASAGEQAPVVEQQSAGVETKMSQLNPPAAAGHRTGRFLTMSATGYSPQEPGLNDGTASGMKAQRGVVAVDPGVIPLGTRVNVEGYGDAIAADTGSAIKGYRIDLCFDTLAECRSFGRRTVKVEILD
jgi:3D (Asp-Asp-Asp) domain-containing protein